MFYKLLMLSKFTNAMSSDIKLMLHNDTITLSCFMTHE